MKILYFCVCEPADNQDELAIAHALVQLGHSVTFVHEKRRHRQAGWEDVLYAPYGTFDFCLLHKVPTVSEVALIKVPRVYWFFDLMDGRHDLTLKARSEARLRWQECILQHCALGFHTDGDFVNTNGSPKLRWLMQGADERVAGYGKCLYDPVTQQEAYPEVLFTGMIKHGTKRAEHVHRLQQRYGGRFAVLGDGGPRRRKHGRDLADVFATTKVVVSPDGPCSDSYWSNRVYLTLSLGGFLLHPYCRGLASQFSPQELATYGDRDQLESMIDFYLGHPEEREELRLAGYRTVMQRHLYRHRLAYLIEEVRRVL